MHVPDVICRREQQLQSLNQISRIERSLKAQLYQGFEAGNLTALNVNGASVGLTTTLGISWAREAIPPQRCEHPSAIQASPEGRPSPAMCATLLCRGERASLTSW